MQRIHTFFRVLPIPSFLPLFLEAREVLLLSDEPLTFSPVLSDGERSLHLVAGSFSPLSVKFPFFPPLFVESF